MFSFIKPTPYYNNILKFLAKNRTNISSSYGTIITRTHIRMKIGDKYFDSFGHMSYRLKDKAIIFKDPDVLDVSEYYCIILLDNRIFVNTTIINDNSKIIINR